MKKRSIRNKTLNMGITEKTYKEVEEMAIKNNVYAGHLCREIVSTVIQDKALLDMVLNRTSNKAYIV